MDNPNRTTISPFFVIGLVFVMNGIVMSLTLGLAIGISFLSMGIVFMILGVNSKGEKGEERKSG